MILSGPFFPDPSQNKMSKVGDKAFVREDFLKNRRLNLDHLLRKRYEWMNDYLSVGDCGIELGSGAGFSTLYIRDDITLWQSDCEHEPWLSAVIDGMSLPFADDSLDFVIAVDVIHHLAKPLLFFREVSRVLKTKGKLILKDIHASLAMRAVLTLMKHEGFSYDVEPFNVEKVCNDPLDPWSGNNAVADLMKADASKLNTEMGLKTIHYREIESLMLYLSGGVTARSKTVQLSQAWLDRLSKIDDFLSKSFSSIFPTGMEWVLENKS
jgi:SAM-dependent methyltransferase